MFLLSARIAYVEACYREMCPDKGEARSLAVLAYAAYVALIHLRVEAPEELPAGKKSELLLRARVGVEDQHRVVLLEIRAERRVVPTAPAEDGLAIEVGDVAPARVVDVLELFAERGEIEVAEQVDLLLGLMPPMRTPKSVVTLVPSSTLVGSSSMPTERSTTDRLVGPHMAVGFWLMSPARA